MEKPSWVVEVSNTEVRFNHATQQWEYYSTAQGEEDGYICSVKQNEQGEYEFCSFAETLDPVLHPEVLVDSSWDAIAARMRATGVGKCLPVSREDIGKLEVRRFPDFGNIPVGLRMFFKGYSASVFYPYSEKGPVGPTSLGNSTYGKTVFMDGPNGDVARSVKFYFFDNNGDFREIAEGESLVPKTGTIAKLGDELLMIKSGSIELLGRQEFEDTNNRMLLDTFVRDVHGRLMVPQS